jgi:hypothetical protein
MTHHQAWMIAHFPGWQGWPESPRLLLLAAVLNLAEFGYWLGLPMLGLFLWAVVAGVRSLLRRNDNGVALVSVATALLLLITAWFGGSIGETARLWIFMIPAVALVAADRVAGLAGAHARTVLLVLAATQFAWMFLLKAQQDFW